MDVPHGETGRNSLQRRVGRSVLAGVTGEHAAADQQTRAPIVERAVDGEIARVGKLSFLGGAADPRGRIVELARAEIRGETDVVANAFADVTVNARSQLPPGLG